MILLPIYKRGLVVAQATLDDEDAYLLEWRWHLNRYGHVRRNTRRSGGVCITLYLHRVVYFARIHNPEDQHMHIHHINGDKLDNRHENLEALPPDVHGQITRKMSGGFACIEAPGDIPL